jgi:hypothetical protein
VHQIAVYGVEAAKGSAVSEVYVAVNGGATNIHADIARGDGGERFFFAAQAVMYLKWSCSCHRAKVRKVCGIGD